MPQENELQRKSSTVLVASQHQPNVTSRPSRQWHGSDQGCPPPCLQRMGERWAQPHRGAARPPWRSRSRAAAPIKPWGTTGDGHGARRMSHLQSRRESRGGTARPALAQPLSQQEPSRAQAAPDLRLLSWPPARATCREMPPPGSHAHKAHQEQPPGVSFPPVTRNGTAHARKGPTGLLGVTISPPHQPWPEHSARGAPSRVPQGCGSGGEPSRAAAPPSQTGSSNAPTLETL